MIDGIGILRICFFFFSHSEVSEDIVAWGCFLSGMFVAVITN